MPVRPLRHLSVARLVLKHKKNTLNVKPIHRLTFVRGWVFCPVVWWSCFALILGSLPDTVFLLGRCPVESASGLTAGRFFSDSSDQIVVEARLGELELVSVLSKKTVRVGVLRLVLLREGKRGFEPVWRSGVMLEPKTVAVGVVSEVATIGDLDLDGYSEVIFVGADSCRVFKWGEGERKMFLPSEAVCGAVWADVDGDTFPELVTLEEVFDSLGSRQVINVWRPEGGTMVRKGAPVKVAFEGKTVRFTLLGAARLEDYPGTPVILMGEEPVVKPGIYGAIFAPARDSFVFSFLPFPYRDWFSKEAVLPSGRLQLFNVGDTLVAYGFFVPGSRPDGPAKSFAALEDGEWRLLRLRESARRLEGPVCRFRYRGQEGWLELRNNLFYFYPGEVFYWR
ncbi:MAG: FG-GAP repeat domain-containing protein [bacterium]